ncbi:MAG: hypothetical protein AB8B81_06875 [Halioglobus sp.]
MNTFKALLIALSFYLATMAQAADLEGWQGKRDILKMGLYPPDIIMRHQQKLGVSVAQRKKITGAVKAFQSDIAELQWSLENEQQIMRQTLIGHPIASGDALQQVERVLSLESQFKLAHFKLLIAIKNELSDEQIDLLQRTLKRRMEAKGLSVEGS